MLGKKEQINFHHFRHTPTYLFLTKFVSLICFSVIPLKTYGLMDNDGENYDNDADNNDDNFAVGRLSLAIQKHKSDICLSQRMAAAFSEEVKRQV